MKIKTVCDITGLTDRAIRFYIEEGLISPTYTENYLGRKSFDFSQKDIDRLRNISVLRNYDFTIDEIRQIICDVKASRGVITSVVQRLKASVSLGEEKLLALSKIDILRLYTLEQLADELSKPTIALSEPSEIVKLNPLKAVVSVLKSVFVFMLVWLPVVLSLFVVILSVSDFHYPIFNHTAIGLTIASFVPAFGIRVVSKTHWKRKIFIR